MNPNSYIACLEIVKSVAASPSEFRFGDGELCFQYDSLGEYKYKDAEDFPFFTIADEFLGCNNKSIAACVVYLKEDDLIYSDEYLNVNEIVNSVSHLCKLLSSTETSRSS